MEEQRTETKISNINLISEFIDELSFLKDFEDNYLDPVKYNNLKFARDYNKQKIKIDLSHIGMGGQQICSQILTEVVDDAADTIYQHYLDEKLPQHCSYNSIKMPKEVIINEFQLFDTNMETYKTEFKEEDEEPERPTLETWTR